MAVAYMLAVNYSMLKSRLPRNIGILLEKWQEAPLGTRSSGSGVFAAYGAPGIDTSSDSQDMLLWVQDHGEEE